MAYNVTYIYKDNDGVYRTYVPSNPSSPYTIERVSVPASGSRPQRYITRWQPYQSSDIVEYGETVQLKKTGNNFYEVSAPEENTHTMRVTISCGEFPTIDLGEIQAITDTFNSSITSIPILPYGYRRSFAMDTGVQRQISISYKRVMPVNPNDQSDDSRLWTNKKWIAALKDYTNRWQMRTNGCRMHILCPSNNNYEMEDTYTFTDHPITPAPQSGRQYENDELGINGYISSMPIKYDNSTKYVISNTLTFRVGTIYPKPKEVPMVTVGLFDKADPNQVKATMKYPIGTYAPLPYLRLYTANNRRKFISKWYKKVGNNYVPVNQDEIPAIDSYIGTPFYVGTNVSEQYNIYADSIEYGTPIQTDGTYTALARHTYQILVCGGGGAGGWGGSRPLGDCHHMSGGGGGGGGSIYTLSYTPSVDTVLSLTIGAGGTVGTKWQTTGDGGTTRVSANGSTIVSAIGGKHGINGVSDSDSSSFSEGGAGGQGQNISESISSSGGAGGTSKPKISGNVTSSENGKAIADDGHPGNGHVVAYREGIAGGYNETSGAGGGGGVHGEYVSAYGGNGGYYVYEYREGRHHWEVTPATNGTFGGGGGGGPGRQQDTDESEQYERPGTGGKGFVMIADLGVLI